MTSVLSSNQWEVAGGNKRTLRKNTVLTNGNGYAELNGHAKKPVTNGVNKVAATKETLAKMPRIEQLRKIK